VVFFSLRLLRKLVYCVASHAVYSLVSLRSTPRVYPSLRSEFTAIAKLP